MTTLHKSLAGTALMLIGLIFLGAFLPWGALFLFTAGGMFFLSAARDVLKKQSS